MGSGGARVLAGEELPRRVVGGREDLLERMEFSNPLAWERLLDLLTPTLTVRSFSILISFFPLSLLLLLP